jgi:signal transduction histidine kinase
MRLGRTLTEDQLPAPVRVAVSGTRAWLEPHLSYEEGSGLDAFSRAGVYAPLRARNTLLGLIALEHHQADHFDRRDRDLLTGFAEPAALAIDNARWFARLRTVGAHEERSRIARDLHDRVGQSLAYLAFQLDRLVGQARKGAAVADELGALREDVRTVIGEVRETLFDLRTDVTPERGLGETLATFLQRVRKRADVEVALTRRESARIALPRERELWRIAQEAITNAERHAQARHLDVTWECTPFEALLTVADDGRGFDNAAGRSDAYGLVGMRERADAIGARLDVSSSSGGGTVVRCRVSAP